MIQDWPLDESGMMATNWTGLWYGTIESYPENALGHGWNVTMEIGLYPQTINSCTTWRSIFTEYDVVKLKKDYVFCRGPGVDDFYIDEGNEKAAGRQIHNVLVSGLKLHGSYALATMRMRGNILEEEILMTDDPLAENKNIVISARPQSLNLKRLRRQPT